MIFPHREVSGVRSVGFSFFALSLLMLSGCKYQDTVHDIGALELTKHIVIHTFRLSDGMSQDLRGITLCVRGTDRCISDPHLQVNPWWEEEAPPDKIDPFIAVTSDKDESLIKFFDTRSGAEIPCYNCGPGWSKARSLANKDHDLFRLNHNRSVAFDPSPPAGITLAQVSSAGVVLRQIETLARNPSDTVLGANLSEDASTAAWYTCGATCTLHAYDLESGHHEDQDTHCPSHPSLGVRWSGNVPHAVYKDVQGTATTPPTPQLFDGEQDFCRNAQGEIALPIEYWVPR